ncbi:MAG: aminopeptidase P family protein [Bacteroidales bacterium]|nr:aminopeptidase P family protein [Bacteroidales bacterium]
MFKDKVYIERRNKLREQLDSGLVLILGNTEASMNYPANTYHWRQDSSFLYFFGLDYPDLAGIMDIDSGEDYIFGNDVDMDDIIWMGNQPTMKERSMNAGINNVFPYDNIVKLINEAKEQKRKVHFLPPYRAENIIRLEKLLDIHHSMIKDHVSVELIKAVVNLRSVKDKYEIKDIEGSVDVAYKMHTTAMKMAKPGIYEREIAGVVEGIALSHGGPVSFPVILSINGQTLHNHYHGNLLKKGRMMVTDAGAESILHYASDITRTVPVGGKFDQRQKEIYEIVLNANMAAINATKPGITNKELHLLSAKTIASGLKDLGLMKGNIDDAVSQGAHAMFFPHGLGHMMGLDVHDMEDLGENYVGYDDEIKRSKQFGLAFLRLGRKLQKGFVFTIEPGCYFIPALIDQWRSEKKFMDFINYDKAESYKDFGGIRIEDDILVTKSGFKVLGKPIPKTVKEIEKTMAG